MMKRLNFFLSILGLLVFVTSATGQSAEAQSLLSSTIDHLKSADGFTGEFSMKIYFGNDLEHEEVGKMSTAGEKILMDLASYKYIADGTSSWTYLKDRNEVQINDLSEDDFSMYNPSTLLNHFFEGGFDYEITDKSKKDNIDLVKLDIKPQDRESEYAKITVIISEKNKLPTEFNIIQKDGTRFQIDLIDVKLNPTIAADAFTFNEKDYPDIIVEDLRLGE